MRAKEIGLRAARKGEKGIPPWGILAYVKPSYTKDRDALKTRLSRIEGQVRGVSRMVDEEAYCIDVLTQINAIKAAIDQVGLLLLEDHIKGCVTTAVRQGDQSKVDELVKAVERFTKA
jgi:DNA-binding FrmR family transcriptional regulator